MYITDQRKEPYASMRLGAVTVSYGGCGVVAAYNALLSLGKTPVFQDVLSYFTSRPSRMFLSGRLGLLPAQLASFFRNQGYRVKVTASKRNMDRLAQSAEASVLYYMFPVRKRFLGLPLRLPEAHFVAFSRTADGYLARNANTLDGIARFTAPSSYGSKKPRFLPIGIYLFSK